MSVARPLGPYLDRLQRRSLFVGGIGIVVCAVGAFFQARQFFAAYLLGYMFWLSISLGCLALSMLHHLVRGRWGVVTNRIYESGAGTLPLMTLLFLPIALGIPFLYVWAHPEAVAADKILQHKAPYLNVLGFLGRAVLYFATWVALATFLSKWSLARDDSADPWLTQKLAYLSSGGLVALTLTVTFASFDWLMSLEPHWFSTAFGAVIGIGAVVAGFAFALVMLAWLMGYLPLADVVAPNVLNDLGSLLLAFLMVWAYLAFSQFLIIWSGNLPDEITWYLRRFSGGWQAFPIALVLLHFVVPFLLLLSREIKQNVHYLLAIAGGLLLMRFVDLYWTIMPAFAASAITIHWLDVVTPIAIGGVWLFAFAGQLKSRPLLPRNDPAWGREVPAEVETEHG